MATRLFVYRKIFLLFHRVANYTTLSIFIEMTCNKKTIRKTKVFNVAIPTKLQNFLKP